MTRYRISATGSVIKCTNSNPLYSDDLFTQFYLRSDVDREIYFLENIIKRLRDQIIQMEYAVNEMNISKEEHQK